MSSMKYKLRKSETAVVTTLGIIILMASVSESARSLGLGLFHKIVESYLVMFVDTMSVAFVCV